MRFEIDLYHPLYRPHLIELLKQENFRIPPDKNLNDLALCVWDTKKGNMAGFLFAIIGLGQNVFINSLIIDKEIKKTNHRNRILMLLKTNLENSLRLMDKKSYDFIVKKDNKGAIALFEYIGAERLLEGYQYHKKLSA